jgi:hypothetical protein
MDCREAERRLRNGAFRHNPVIANAIRFDCFAPKAEIGCLIDDLIGTGENGLRHRYAQRFGCLPVDDHFQIPFTRYAAVWLGR